MHGQYRGPVVLKPALRVDGRVRGQELLHIIRVLVLAARPHADVAPHAAPNAVASGLGAILNIKLVSTLLKIYPTACGRVSDATY
jgi:hypothetical protein